MPNSKNISDWHADYANRSLQWAKIRDALEGEDRVKNQGSVYLKQPGGMTLAEYDAYKDRASFYAVAERTLRGMSGMVFRHPIKVELPDRMEPLRETCTTDGHNLEILAEIIVNENLSVGRYGLLLDYAKEVATVTDVPYIATYQAEDITDWEQDFVGGKKVLRRVVVKDDIDNQGAKDTLRYLELMINEEGNYEVRKWEADSSGDSDEGFRNYTIVESTVPTVNGRPPKEIPFVFVNPYNLRPAIEKPPMTDLVNVNISHYRNSADYEHALFLTAQPTPWIAGNLDEANKPNKIGSGTIWYLPDGAVAGMLEFQGAGVAAQRDAMSDKEGRMAALGARMIHEGQNRNEASDTARMRGRGELSLLTNVVNMAEGAIEKVLRIAAEWVGSNPDDIEVRLNRDWVETRLDPQALTALVKAWQAGGMSHQTLYENLQSGEIAPVDRSFDEEKDLIENEGGDLSGGLMQSLVSAAQLPPGANNVPPNDATTSDDGES